MRSHSRTNDSTSWKPSLFSLQSTIIEALTEQNPLSPSWDSAWIIGRSEGIQPSYLLCQFSYLTFPYNSRTATGFQGDVYLCKHVSAITGKESKGKILNRKTMDKERVKHFYASSVQNHSFLWLLFITTCQSFNKCHCSLPLTLFLLIKSKSSGL